MKIKMKIEKEFDVKYLKASCGVRYWEDATVNKLEDVGGILIPCRNDQHWEPLIEIETGKILNWEKGKTANTHYKVCDDGVYTLLDENKEDIKEIDGYVPDIMCPEGDGFGDYVIMVIDENGMIQNWKADFDDFFTEED